MKLGVDVFFVKNDHSTSKVGVWSPWYWIKVTLRLGHFYKNKFFQDEEVHSKSTEVHETNHENKS